MLNEVFLPQVAFGQPVLSWQQKEPRSVCAHASFFPWGRQQREGELWLSLDQTGFAGGEMADAGEDTQEESLR